MVVYEDYKIFGPYKSGNGRLIIQAKKDKTRIGISYPKYLVEVHLNRYLLDNETIDHIDNDFTNNDLSNLRIVDRKIHCEQDVLRRGGVILNCVWCNKEFTVEGKKVRERNRKNASGFCSRQCTGQYGKHVQLGGDKKGKIDIERTYYREKDLIEVSSILQ